MAGICCGVVGETEAAAATTVEPSARAKRRTRLELRPFTFVASAEMAVPPQPEDANRRKRHRLEPVQAPRDFDNQGIRQEVEQPGSDADRCESSKQVKGGQEATADDNTDKFGMTSVCGRRRDMEDAVSIHPSFGLNGTASFFGVFDGHGCSHVAMRCRDRLHEILQEEIGGCGNGNSVEWKDLMERSFSRMDKDVEEWTGTTAASAAAAGGRGGSKISSCRCELQTPQCDAVGSTAVVAVLTPDKIVVSNCGDSRAVLCRNGVAIPLSTDHKPDRPDELHRIEAAGGRVIYWDGPRVLGVLAMSRAIGDSYLKPYVIPTPEVTVMERTEEDECLILASDGLWDVVSNETACGVARMCLKAQKLPSPPLSPGSGATVGGGSAASSDKACSDASILLTKLALARHSTDNVSVVVVDLKENRRT